MISYSQAISAIIYNTNTFQCFKRKKKKKQYIKQDIFLSEHGTMTYNNEGTRHSQVNKNNRQPH